jgi:hypothetical protein
MKIDHMKKNIHHILHDKLDIIESKHVIYHFFNSIYNKYNQFKFDKNDIDIFIKSIKIYNLIHNTNTLSNINKQYYTTYEYQCLLNHYQSLDDYILSNHNIPHTWIQYWQYYTDFIKKNIHNTASLYNIIINKFHQHFDNHNLQINLNINNNKNNLDNLQNTNIIQNISWKPIIKELRLPINQWNLIWTLFNDCCDILHNIILLHPYYDNQILNQYHFNNIHLWKEIIKNSDIPEETLKTFTSAFFQLLQKLVNIHSDIATEYKKKLYMLNEDCKNNIHTQSYEKCIPHIFQIMYQQSNALFSIFNNKQLYNNINPKIV